jgi:hypothetical protein
MTCDSVHNALPQTVPPPARPASVAANFRLHHKCTQRHIMDRGDSYTHSRPASQPDDHIGESVAWFPPEACCRRREAAALLAHLAVCRRASAVAWGTAHRSWARRGGGHLRQLGLPRTRAGRRGTADLPDHWAGVRLPHSCRRCLARGGTCFPRSLRPTMRRPNRYAGQQRRHSVGGALARWWVVVASWTHTSQDRSARAPA